jgi:DNA-binding CsgD family transcriptional regulator
MTIIAAGVLALADREEALDAWAAAMAEGHTRGSRLTVSGVHLWRGWCWLQRGALDEARSELEEYVVATELRGGAGEAGMAYCSGFLSRVLVEQGDLEAARAATALSASPTPGSDGDLQHRRGVIEVLLADGRWAEALAEVATAGARSRRRVNPAWVPFGSLEAKALVGLGRTAEAVARATEELTAARRWGAPGAVGAALRSLGVAVDADGSDGCLPFLEEAVAVTAPSAARLEQAKCLAALGSALRRRGRPADARAPLSQAADLATVCGATPVVDLATGELAAAGGRRLGRGVAGLDALTPSERRVATLAAAGRSNKAIAQELFVTPKTVEVHLSSAYRKLGITSRGDLAAAGLSP